MREGQPKAGDLLWDMGLGIILEVKPNGNPENPMVRYVWLYGVEDGEEETHAYPVYKEYAWSEMKQWRAGYLHFVKGGCR